MFRAYMYKLLHSPIILISIIGVVALCCTNFLTYDFSYGDVVSHMNVFFNIGVYRKAMTIFAAFPFAANFADEWSSGITSSCIIRRGIFRYSAANLLFCIFSSIFTVFIGIMIFSVAYSFFVPIYVPNGNPYTFIFGQYLSSGQGMIFLMLRVLVFSVSCAMWTVMGMLLSALFPNKYVAICTPFVASYIIERITIQLPEDLNLWYLSLSLVTFKNDIIGFIYCISVFLIIMVLCGLCFIYLLKRRLQNGSF